MLTVSEAYELLEELSQPEDTEHSDIGSLITSIAKEMELTHKPEIGKLFLQCLNDRDYTLCYCVGYTSKGELALEDVGDLDDDVHVIKYSIARTRDWTDDMQALHDIGISISTIVEIVDLGFSREVLNDGLSE